jgi:hypothetical protein
MADTTETQLSEENDTNETQATSAPQTPPRNFRQAATYIMSTIMWREATDGHVQHQQLNNPITHHPNYYAQLKEIVDSKSTKIKLRPELLQFGKLHLKPEIYEKGYLLSQNVTTLKEKNERLEIKTKSTQTPETVETTTRQSMAFLSDSQVGLTAPAVLAGTDSDSSTKITNRCFQPGEIGESNAESAERHREIQRNIKRKMRRRDKRRRKLNQRLQRLLEQQLRHISDEEGNGSSTIEGAQTRSMIAAKVLKQGVQTLTIDDINPHDLYPHQDKPLKSGPIDLLYDTGASITMLPLDYAPAWRNLRPCLHQLTGCFGKEGTQSDLQIGEFHGLLKLDSDEVIRVVIPEAIALPADTSSTYLLSDTQFLLAGNHYNSDLREPKIVFETGGIHAIAVKAAHKVIELLPTRATEKTTH